MSADFWAGYISGAAGIVIGNPLDLLKVRLQAGRPIVSGGESWAGQFDSAGSLVRGVTAPILGYGALNALLFVSYNRTLSAFGEDPLDPLNPWKIWAAGAVGGLATWAVSAPTELVKCRVQLGSRERSSWTVARDIWRDGGIRGLYVGGGVTSVRDAVGYGFYFWSYQLSKQWATTPDESEGQAAVKVLLCGGLAGIVTWASIFPLDVIKTRVQTQISTVTPVLAQLTDEAPLMPTRSRHTISHEHGGAVAVAKEIYQREGFRAFFRGIGVCSARAFVVNAVQWATYEWIIRFLGSS